MRSLACTLLTGADDDGILLFDAAGANGHRGLWAVNTSTLEATPLITDGAGATVDGVRCSSRG